MAYQSWSVVFGEQPSAAKWNILGTNDASFNTALTLGRQNNTSNSQVTDQLIQFGWGFVAGDGASRSVTETVTFPTAYSVIPIVLISDIGVKGSSDPTDPGDTSAGATHTWKADLDDTSTTTATIRISRNSADGADPGVLPTASRYLYTWLAIGDR